MLPIPALFVPEQAVVRLDDARQTIESFGASDCWTFQTLGAWSEEEKNRLADLLFTTDKGIGLSLWRFNVGGGRNPRISRPDRTVETFEVAEGRYDWTRQATERWFLRAARKRGVRQFVAFVNSPPGRMTRSGHTFADPASKASTNLKEGYEAPLARYLADVLDHFRKDGLPFDWISPVNEPQWAWADPKQEGNRASNEDVKRIALALGDELRRRKLGTKISLVEAANLPGIVKPYSQFGATYGGYADALLGDPAIAPLMHGRLAYHSYFSDRLSGEIIADREAVRAKMAQYPDARLWMSEYCILEGPEGRGGGGRDLTMRTALDVARVMHLDLTLCDVTSWQWWLALSSADYKDGLLYTDAPHVTDPKGIVVPKLFWAFGNFSRFVRPGMRRVGLGEGPPDLYGLMGSAYLDSKGKKVIVVYVNEGDKRQVEVAFEGRPGWKLRSIERFITSDAVGDDHRRTVVEGTTVEIPARSVATFVVRFR